MFLGILKKHIFLDEKWNKIETLISEKMIFDFDIFPTKIDISSDFQILRFFSKSSRFFIFSYFQNFPKNVKIFADFQNFRFFQFFCWDFQISDLLGKFQIFPLTFQDSSYFLIFQKFRIFQPNKFKMEEICKKSRRFACAYLEYHTINT